MNTDFGLWKVLEDAANRGIVEDRIGRRHVAREELTLGVEQPGVEIEVDRLAAEPFERFQHLEIGFRKRSHLGVSPTVIDPARCSGARSSGAARSDRPGLPDRNSEARRSAASRSRNGDRAGRRASRCRRQGHRSPESPDRDRRDRSSGRGRPAAASALRTSLPSVGERCRSARALDLQSLEFGDHAPARSPIPSDHSSPSGKMRLGLARRRRDSGRERLLDGIAAGDAVEPDRLLHAEDQGIGE